MQAIWKKLQGTLGEGELLDSVLILTLLLLAVSPGSELLLFDNTRTSAVPVYQNTGLYFQWLVLSGSVILAMAGLVSKELRYSPKLWGILSLLTTSYYVIYNWRFSDNHKFVIAYWCIALTVALTVGSPGRARQAAAGVAWSGRIMVGLVFGLATFWKLTSLSYLNGSTFDLLLLTDERFFAMANAICGYSVEQFTQNKQTLQQLGNYPLKESYELVRPSGAGALAQFLTWWTILIEGLLALLFLLERGDRWEKWRHWVLLFFIFTTYPPTGVILFGWVLIVMALACVPERDAKTRTLYLLVLFYISIFAGDFVRKCYMSLVS